jgi:hypothetical protein
VSLNRSMVVVSRVSSTARRLLGSLMRSLATPHV